MLTKREMERNIFFILLLGIIGISFGLLDWDSVMSDLVYITLNSKLLISIITANIGVVKVIATLISIKLTDSRHPNNVLTIFLILCIISAIIISIIYKMQWIILFIIMYLIEILFLEVVSMYQYSYIYNSLPEEEAIITNSKRITVFKVFFMIGVTVAGYISTKNTGNAVVIISLLSIVALLISILVVSQVKNDPKVEKKEKITLIQKLNLKKYSKFFKRWLILKVLGELALSSLVVIISVYAIDKNLSVERLKIVKSTLWLLSASGFFISAYLIKKNLIINIDIFIKSLILILLPCILYVPEIVFILLILNGIRNPFNTMTNFYILQRDKDNINNAQKELIIRLGSFLAQIVAGYVLVKMSIEVAIVVIVITLSINTIMEGYVYVKSKKKIKE